MVIASKKYWIFSSDSDYHNHEWYFQYFLTAIMDLQSTIINLTLDQDVGFYNIFSIVHSWPENIVKSQTSWYSVGSYL